MVKTKRRNIKKRNTRRKNSKISLKKRTKYTNNKKKYKNTNRKTRNRQTQRGGGVTFVGIDKETGKHIYYSDTLEERIEITPLPRASTAKAYSGKQSDQQTQAKIVHEQAVKAKQDEKDKQYTIELAMIEEKRRIGNLEDAMFETSSFSSAKRETPFYLLDEEQEKSKRPTLTSRPVPPVSLAKSSGLQSMHSQLQSMHSQLPRAKGKEPHQSVSSGSDDDSDLGGDEKDDIARLEAQLKLDKEYIKKYGMPDPPRRQFKQSSHGAVAVSIVTPPYKPPTTSLFQALRTKVNQLVSDDIDTRLTDVFRRLYTDSETQKIIRECPPCLQHYILFRLEGQGITNDMIRTLRTELKNGKGPQLRLILRHHNLFPIPETFWVPDRVCERSAIPHDRGKEFGLLTRKHHCRCCGRCVTAEYIESGTDPSVCTECDRILTRM
jgi:hypothetical protein